MKIHPLQLWYPGYNIKNFNNKNNHNGDKSNPNSLSKDSEMNTLIQNLPQNNRTINLNPNKLNKEKNQKRQIITKKIFPRKSFELNKNSISLKQSPLLIKNTLYKNAFINNFRPIISLNKTQSFPKNKRQLNKNKEKSNSKSIDTKDINTKPKSIFEVYKNYQKNFFSSTFNHTNMSGSYTLIPNNTNNVLHYNKIIMGSNKTIKLIKRPPRAISNLLVKKDLDRIPMVINSPVSFVKNFKSNSEKERDEKNSTALLKLRNILDKNWNRRLELVKEFFIINQINDEEYYSNVHLENFAHFFYDNINNDTNMMKGIIETRIPMKQIIMKGIKFKNYSMRKLVKSNTMPVFNNKRNRKTGTQIRNKFKNMSILINHFIRIGRKKSTIELNKNDINDKYQISEEGKEDKKRNNAKIIEFKNFMNKNYAANIINKFMGNYNKEEKLNYFNKRKVGTIYIPDKGNLANNINKQTEFFKLKSTAYESKLKSIHSFSEKDVNDLRNELKQIKEDYINENDKDKENFWVKTFENMKKKKFEKYPENILKEKKKLLEYIVYQNIKERKEFEKDILK